MNDVNLPSCLFPEPPVPPLASQKSSLFAVLYTNWLNVLEAFSCYSAQYLFYTHPWKAPVPRGSYTYFFVFLVDFCVSLTRSLFTLVAGITSIVLLC